MSTLIDRQFAGLRARARNVLGVDGLVEFVATAALWVLGSLALDRWLEMPLPARVLMLSLLALVLARAAFGWAKRLGSSLAPETLARSVEARFPELEGQLLNALALRDELRTSESGGPGVPALERDLLGRALSEAEAAVARVPFKRALRLRGFFVRGLLGAAAVGALVLVGARVPRTLGLWFQRNVLLSSQLWPRETQLALDRKESVWHIARGDSLEILGHAKGKIPDEVVVRLKTSSSERDATIVPAPNGRLSLTLPEVPEGFDFQLRGGDAVTETRRVETHERPRIVNLRVSLTSPAYLEKQPETLENIAGDVTVPAGTTVVLQAKCDQPLELARLRWEKDEPVVIKPSDPERILIEHRLEPQRSGILDLSVVESRFALESRPPLRLRVQVKPDLPPRVTLTLKQKARLVTANGSIPYRIDGRDDHGFSRLGLEVELPTQSDADEKRVIPVENLTPRTSELVREGVLDLAPLKLEPGTRIRLTAEGADNDALNGPKVARSGTETIDVVAPEDFQEAMARARAEARRNLEDVLRREENVVRELAALVDREKPSKGAPSTQAERAPSTDAAKANAPRGNAARVQGGTKAKGAPKAAGAPKDSKAAKSETATDAKEPSEKDAKENASADPDAKDSAQASAAKASGAKKGGAKQAPGANAKKGANAKNGADAAQPEGAPQEGEPQSEEQPSPESDSPQDPGEPNPEEETPPPSGDPVSDEAQRRQRIERTAREQADVAERLRRTEQDLREVADALNRNEQQSEAEAKRFDAEVAEPLEELAKERVPRAAERIKEAARQANQGAQDPKKAEEDLLAEQKELESIADRLREVLDRLADTEEFADVLQRLEGVLDLHRAVIKMTREKSKDAPVPAVESTKKNATDKSTKEKKATSPSRKERQL